MSLKLTSLIAYAGIGFCLAACTSAPPQQTKIGEPAQCVAPAMAPPPTAPVVPGPPVFKPVAFDTIPGWGSDDLRAAWPAFLASCSAIAKKNEWKEVCNLARDVEASDAKAVRAFFQTFFIPYQVLNSDGSDTGLITGYYEPLLRGARKRGGAFQTPLYRTPEDMLTIDLASVYPELKSFRLRGRIVGNKILPYFSRAELMQSNLLAGKELLWVDNPVDAFFLQVQGSGRVQLADTGEVVRVAYADQNGHPYKSIGRYLVDKGEMRLDQASAQGIKAWAASHPNRLHELLNANPSYVFFKEEPLPDSTVGPKGALGVPLTPNRSIAIDPQFISLGAPVFLATTQPASETPLQQLMVAQDTGGAIRNPVRADFFWGFGKEAGEKAGKMKQRGKMWLLLPRTAVPKSKE